jgi:branched-chain amino acid transport system ATP-binding protein
MATQPRLLLLDEVMAGLNPTEVTEIVALIRGVRDAGVTVLLIEHVMQAVAALADHAYDMAEGALIAAGTPREIARDPRVVEAYLGQGASQTLLNA